MILFWIFYRIFGGVALLIIALIITIGGILVLGGISAYLKAKKKEETE